MLTTISSFLKTDLSFVKISFTGKGVNTVIEGKKGDNIQHLCEQHKIPLPYACEGNCACGTCHVYVKKGSELFDEPTDQELDTLDFAVSVRDNSRLACRCTLNDDNGEVELEIPEQARNII